MSTELLIGFIVADLALILSPGPDWIYVLTRGIAHGRPTALWSVAGVCASYLAHTVMVVAGLAAIVTASATAFTAIRIAGALYITYLGIRLLTTRTNPFAASNEADSPTRRTAIVQGAWTSGLNPKAYSSTSPSSPNSSPSTAPSTPPPNSRSSDSSTSPAAPSSTEPSDSPLAASATDSADAPRPPDASNSAPELCSPRSAASSSPTAGRHLPANNPVVSTDLSRCR